MTAASRAPILIGLGANLPSQAGPPAATLAAAIDHLADAGIVTLQRSRWFVSAPLPASDQPWFVNGVIAVATALEPAALLAELHRVEAAFGQHRRVHAPDQVTQLGKGLLGLDVRPVNQLAGGVRVVGELRLGPAELHGQRDQPLLRAVVQVTLDPSQLRALLVHRAVVPTLLLAGCAGVLAALLGAPIPH